MSPVTSSWLADDDDDDDDEATAPTAVAPRPAPPVPPASRRPSAGWIIAMIIGGLIAWSSVVAPALGLTSHGQPGARYGAICRDGWRSSATGSGACSHHGGVDHWLVYPAATPARQ